MEIKRNLSIYFLVKEMRKDLFVIDKNNPTDEDSLFAKLKILNFNQSVKKINDNK
jgi:hypothetical protein|tara:strand:+ start:315 stop:479 length:165 start_codon:yes stop_codon:yes gene_type:complete